MEDKKPGQLYRDAFSTALSQSVSNRQASVLALLASIASVDLFFLLFGKNSILFPFTDSFATLLERHPIMFLAGIIVCSALYVFLKGAVLLSINTVIAKKRRPTGVILSAAMARFVPYITFEILIILALSVIFLLLGIPGSLSSDNAPLSQSLTLLAEIAFIPIFVTLAIIELYGSFYLLFSKVSPKTAFDLGYSLLMRRLTETATFGGLFLLTFLLFSVTLNVLLPVLQSSLPDTRIRIAVPLTAFYLLQAAYFSFSKAAWIAFFRSIAKDEPEAAALQTAENVLEKSVPELGHEGESA